MGSNEEFDETFKNGIFNFILDNYGRRCEDYDESCVVCQAWKKFDTMFSKLDPIEPVYKYKNEIWNTFDFDKLHEESKKGWNVCSSIMLRMAGDNSETLFYFRKKI